MARLVLALAFCFAASSASAQTWELVPSVGIGMGSAGDRDLLGDDRDTVPSCSTAGLSAGQCHNAAAVIAAQIAAQRRSTPTASFGLRADRFSSRFALTFGISARLGPADRFVEDDRHPTPTFDLRTGDVSDVYEARFRIVGVVLATGRIRLGAARRGFIGAGPALGWLVEPRGKKVGESPLPSGADPDAYPSGQRSSIHSGPVLEALLEAGVRLGARRRIELSVVGGAGRPLWHAEARIAVPIVVSE